MARIESDGPGQTETADDDCCSVVQSLKKLTRIYDCSALFVTQLQHADTIKSRTRQTPKKAAIAAGLTLLTILPMLLVRGQEAEQATAVG
jgi:hypothetical protein